MPRWMLMYLRTSPSAPPRAARARRELRFLGLPPALALFHALALAADGLASALSAPAPPWRRDHDRGRISFGGLTEYCTAVLVDQR
jgi:hypothetical protein